MMRKSLLCLVFAAAAFGVAASTATAGELTVKIANGRATIIAKDVPVRQILAEWAKVGDTKIMHGEKVPGGPVTLELIDVPEKDALDVLLRTAAGYIAAPRPANLAGASQYDRVIVLATSRPPAATTSVTPPAFGNRANFNMPPPPQLPPDDDDGDPGDQGPNAPPVMGPNGPLPAYPGAPNGPTVGPNGQVIGPGGVINGPNGPVMIGPNGQPVNIGPNGMPVNVQPTTTSRPGQLPQQPQPQVPNTYGTQPRPGPMPPVRPGGDPDQ
jgi:hypothetical protein